MFDLDTLMNILTSLKKYYVTYLDYTISYCLLEVHIFGILFQDRYFKLL